jgi:glycosidase
MRMAVLLQCLLPGAPSIYYGDEIGMTGGNDPGCRAAFPWDRDRWDQDLRAFVRSVLRLRADRPAFRHGATSVAGASGSAVAIERRLDAESLVVVVNAGDEPAELDLALSAPVAGRLHPVTLDGANGTDTDPTPVDIAGGRARMLLDRRAGRVLRVAPGDA